MQKQKKKHIVHNNHRQRLLLELLGLTLLFALCFQQQEVFRRAFSAISNANGAILVLLYFTYWLNVPLTAMSYKVIARKKNLSLWYTSMAQLAGSGPGRIVPGGVGHIGIGSLFLNKSGIPLERAFAISVVNNLIGVLMNFFMLFLALLYAPEIFVLVVNGLSAEHIMIGSVAILVVFGLWQWLTHIRKFRKIVKSTIGYWSKLLADIGKDMTLLISVCSLAVAITGIHVVMLMIAGQAVGQDIPFTYAVIALSVGVAIGGTLPTPGGLGGVEAGILGTLTALGFEASTATSIALLYRSATYWQPLIPGLFAYIYLRGKKLL